MADVHIERLWLFILLAVALAIAGASAAPSRAALLGALVLLVLPLGLIRPETLLPALLILLPFYTLMRRLFLLREPTVLALDPLILLPDLLAASSVMVLAVAVVRGRDPLRWRSGRLPGRRAWDLVALTDAAVVLLVAVTLLAFVTGLNQGWISALNGARMFGLYILLYFFARAIVSRYSQVGVFLAITVLAGLVTGLYGVYQTFVGLPPYDRIYFVNSAARIHVIGEFVRSFSTFQFTSHFSVFMLCAFFSALTLAEQRCGRFVRLVCLAAIPATLVGIATTFVRSTWVGLASALAAYLLLRFIRRPAHRLPIFLALLPLGAILLGLAGPEEAVRPIGDDAAGVLRARAHSVLAADLDGDLSGRYLGLQEALRIASSHPMGHGLGSTSADRFGMGTIAWTGDSQATTLLVEMGWPGLIAFALVLLLVMRCNLAAIDRAPTPDVRKLLVGIASIQVGLIVCSLAGGPLWYAQPSCVYSWLLAGVSVNAAERLLGQKAVKRCGS